MVKTIKQISVCLLFLSASVLTHAECNPLLPPTTPDSRFVPLEEGTVLDTATGLVWMRCAYGTSWNDGLCEDDVNVPAFLNWADALKASAEATYAGHNSWRLPNKIELDSIVERRCSDPALNQDIFSTIQVDPASLQPGSLHNYYWTNTPNQFNSNFSWAIEFRDGGHVTIGRQNQFSVRLVRDYQQSR